MPNYKERICEVCEEPYIPTSPKQKFCIECKDDGRKLADRIRDKKRNRDKFDYQEYNRVCLSCEKEFSTFYSKKVYCGLKECNHKRVRKNGLKVDKRRSEVNKSISVIRKNTKREQSISNAIDYFYKFGYKVINTTEYISSHDGVITVTCPSGHTWETTFHNFKDNKNRCLQCYISNNYVSKLEQKIRDYIETNFNDLEVIYNDRTILYPKELDFYFPNHNLAIEVCGLYWHSDTANGIERSYHYNKMMQCHAKGVRLITIFEDEINNKFDLVMSRIKQALGIIESRIYARKCDIKSVSNKVANDFFESNHIQGKTNSKIAFGLFYDSNMVACCSVGTITRKNANIRNTLELKRFCCIKDTTIVGGASRLFKKVLEFARNSEYNNIKSYCDMRYANIFNPVYEILGFKLLTKTKYTPHYFIKGIRYRNMSLRKTPEERLTGKSELELRIEQGYNRIWDCGHRTYIMEL